MSGGRMEEAQGMTGVIEMMSTLMVGMVVLVYKFVRTDRKAHLM